VAAAVRSGIILPPQKLEGQQAYLTRYSPLALGLVAVWRHKVIGVTVCLFGR
jgi:hypothetical protein